MSRLHELDPTYALVFGINSAWQRLVAFFASCWTAVLVARCCDESINTYESLIHGRISDVLSVGMQYIFWAPITWIGLLLVGFERSLFGIVMLPILGCALLIILFSETTAWHGVFLLLLTHPIHSLWALKPASNISWICLFVYLAAMCWIYFQCIRVH
jgi:hypothetical protein